MEKEKESGSNDQQAPEEDDEYIRLYDLADSLVAECRLASQFLSFERAIHALFMTISKPSNRPDSINALVMKLVDSVQEGAIVDQNKKRTESTQMGSLAEEIPSVETAIFLHREALALRIPPHPQSLASLRSLSMLLCAHLRLANTSEDLNEAVALYSEAAELTGLEPSWLFSLINSQLVKAPESSYNGPLETLTYFCTFANDKLKEFDQSSQASESDTSIILYRKALFLTTQGSRYRIVLLSNLASLLEPQFRQTSRTEDLEEAITLRREAVEIAPMSHPNHSSSMHNLASCLFTLFSQTGQVQDLNEAILLHENVLEMRPVPHPDRPGSLNDLAGCLMARFRQFGEQPSDMDKAVAFHREALELRPDTDPFRLTSFNNLAAALQDRFDNAGDISDLDEAIMFHRKTLEILPLDLPDRTKPLNNLGSALQTRFSERGQVCDLDEAAALHQEALKLLPPPHPDRSNCLNNLGMTLQTRFNKMGHMSDLDQAILCHREAIQLRPFPHPYRTYSLSNLAHALHIKFGGLGQMSDLDEAISLNEESLELRPAPHPGRWDVLENAATSMRTRFSQTGRADDIENAVSLHREAVKLLPMSHPGRFSTISNLAHSLWARFSQSGQIRDLDEGISLYRQVLEVRSLDHPARGIDLSNLAIALRARFLHADKMLDLEEAITLHREALSITPVNQPSRPKALNNLANVLQLRFDKTGKFADLDEAISHNREALGLFPLPHPERSISLNNLSTTLTARYNRTSEIGDLDEAISLIHEAISLLPPLHPDLSKSLHNLSKSLYLQFFKNQRLPSLEDAIATSTEALKILPESHPLRCSFLETLAYELMDMYFETREIQHLNRAISSFRAGAVDMHATSLDRFRATQSWIRYSDLLSLESALEAYQTAIELLRRIAMLGLDVQSRQQALALRGDGLARDAAACAIRSGQFEKAVEFIEEGRAIFWSQALQLRTSFDDLKTKDAGLAEKLKRIANALEMGSYRDSSRTMQDSKQKVMSMEQEAVHYRELNDEWLEILGEVRNLDGFSSFLQPKPLSMLRSSAKNGPVVILNAGKSRCDALIMTSAALHHIPLSNFSPEDAKDLARQIRSSHAPYSDNERGYRYYKAGQRTTSSDRFRSALAKLWNSVVKPIVEALDLKKSDRPPRVWWCTTGVFAFLPIHAAGLYDAKTMKSQEAVFDYVISSYTPTLSALLSPMHRSNIPLKVLAVIQPDSPGYPPLPFTQDEMVQIGKHVPTESLTKLGVVGSPASVENVLANLSSASVVHFACHGKQNAMNPLDSAIILEDGALSVSQIMRHSTPNAKLVFLSACQTATGDEALPDEVMHIAATLLFSGFRGAVATMWSIEDMDGPKVSDDFYRELYQTDDVLGSNGTLDTTRAAWALHLAVEKMRTEGASFARWIPFIHLGL